MSFHTMPLRVVTDDFRIISAAPDHLPPQERILFLAGHARYAAVLDGKLDSGLSVHALEGLPCDPLVIAHRGLRLFVPEERCSRSGGSQACYLACSADDRSQGGHSILVQVLPAHCRTSTHFHADTDEEFTNLLGECDIATLDRTFLEEAESCPSIHQLLASQLTVRRGTIHQMRTGRVPAVNFLVMRGLDRPTCMQDHHYVETDLFALFRSRAP